MTMHATVVFLQNFFLDFFSIFSNNFSKEKKLGRNIIQVYIVKELLLYFSVSFLFFFAIFFVNQILLLAENILRQGAPAWDDILVAVYHCAVCSFCNARWLFDVSWKIYERQ